MNKLSIEEKTRIVAALVEGNSIRSTCRMTGHSKGAVLKLVAQIGEACANFHNETVRGIRARRVSCDEAWSFVYAKAKNVPDEKRDTFGYGDVWTWVAMDSDTKLVISWLVGRRDGDAAYQFMQDVADRLANRIQLTTDGHRPYLEAVEAAFGCEVDYAMLQKIYGVPDEDERRYSPPVCIGCTVHKISGDPDPKHINTSFIERQNLTMRMGMRRFTRLTNGFSKKVENHAFALALHYVHYNFVRIHQTLRVTPAMEAGIVSSPWTARDIVVMADGDSK